MTTTTRRRHLPIDKFQTYNDYYSRYQKESKILNGGAERIPTPYSILWDENNIRFELNQIVGDEKGQYKREEHFHLAFLPFVRMHLEQIEEQWKDYKKERENQGYERPTEMPTKLLNEKYQWEAREDILLYEVEELEKRLQKYANKKQEVDDSKVLYCGLQQSSHLHGTGAATRELMNVLHDIDGQLCGFINGALCIDDPRSPYSGMSIHDYRKFATLWVLDRRLADKAKLKRLQEQAISEGKLAPQSLPTLSFRVSKSSLPPWPDWAIKHTPKVEEVEDSSTVKRKKK